MTWGLHDMIGNAAEWVEDDLVDRASLPSTDPRSVSGTYPVIRGGSFQDDLAWSRVSMRYGRGSRYYAPNVGLRLARYE